jgi:ATP-dependent Clp protease ATP-binding subunit ClpA
MASIARLSQQMELAVPSHELLLFYRYGERTSPWQQLSHEKVLRIGESVRRRVKGQKEAIARVSRVVHRAFTGLSGVTHSSGANKPKGCLFLVGPTGVGKTELAKSMAQFLFQEESRCIRFDMSEYNHDHSDQRLIGAPPGYVGHEAGGQLTNAIRQQPFSVLLFDEIEKAHGRILDKFLQILEDGRLTDGMGRTTQFSEAMILFTSNIGAEQATELYRKKESVETIRNFFVEQVVAYFRKTLQRPELLNRIGLDNIIPFDFMNQSQLREIARLKLEPLGEQLLKRHGVILDFGNESQKNAILDDLVAQCDVLQGGRGMVAQIDTLLTDPLAEFLVENWKSLTGRQTLTVQGLLPKAKFHLV